jgi:DNA-binding MarR family transcriptional regulator
MLTLMRSADCLHRALQQKLKPFGLTSTQYNVLRILRGARPSGLTCSAIGRMMITPEPDITRLLARLKAQKLLCQQRDVHDRRVVWTHITASGIEVLASLDGIAEQAPREFLQDLTFDEVQELTKLLRKAGSGGGSGLLPIAGTSAIGKPPSPHLQGPSRLHPHPE